MVVTSTAAPNTSPVMPPKRRTQCATSAALHASATMTATGPDRLEIESRRGRETVTVTRDGDTFLWWSERYEGARRVRFTEDGALLIAYLPDHPIDERAVYRARCPLD